MRVITTSIAALGFVGAMALSAPSASLAQGFYFEGPGVGIGVGRPYYGDRYYQPYYGDRYYRSYSPYGYGGGYGGSYSYDPYAYGYSYERPYVQERRYYRSRRYRED